MLKGHDLGVGILDISTTTVAGTGFLKNTENLYGTGFNDYLDRCFL